MVESQNYWTSWEFWIIAGMGLVSVVYLGFFVRNALRPKGASGKSGQYQSPCEQCGANENCTYKK